jgi:hypothetical protein
VTAAGAEVAPAVRRLVSTVTRTPSTPCRPDVAGRLRATIAELAVEFGDRYPGRRIAEEATRAALELEGSTHVEALPELITRLVRVRLVDAPRSTGSRTDRR